MRRLPRPKHSVSSPKTRRVSGQRKTKEELPQSPRQQRVQSRQNLTSPQTVNPAPHNDLLPKSLNKHWNRNHLSRIGITAGIGAGVGLAGSLVDKERDDVQSRAEKMINAAGAGIAMDYGAQFGASKLGLTTGILSKREVLDEGKKAMTEVEELRWQKGIKRRLGVASKLGIVALGAATFLDITDGLEADRRAAEERGHQEQELKKKQSTERKRQRQEGYGYTDYGQIVLEQWEKRIGHYAMGNSKFQ